MSSKKGLISDASIIPSRSGAPMVEICCMLDDDRTIALLDYDGNLVTMDTSNGEVKAVADGVESVIDLSVRYFDPFVLLLLYTIYMKMCM